MADKIYFDSQLLLPIQRAGTRSRPAVQQPQAASFDDMLSAAKRQVAFSAHAKARLAERGISLSEQALARPLTSSQGKEPASHLSILTAQPSW